MSSLDPALGLDAAPGLRLKSRLTAARRYGFSTSGPLATSGAHFLASLVFVHNLPAAAFGLFSFVLVIVPFCMSATDALLVVPVTRSLAMADDARAAMTTTCLNATAWLCAGAALAVLGLLLAAHAGLASALPLALFGGVFTYRWFARCFAYIQGRVATAVASDLVYSLCLVSGLGLLVLLHKVSLTGGGLVLLLAAAVSLTPLGGDFFRQQMAALSPAGLRDYLPVFRDLTRWSLLGVALTELTVNAHAYLVTFLAGAGPFALLAVGMLMMRPISLMQSALPDLERPVMTRQIAARDWRGLHRTAREFRNGLLVVWLLTLMLDAGLLHWFPQLLLKKGYSLENILVVTLLSAIIMALRCLRGPPAVLLQAAGSFKELAGIGTKSSVISLLATLALLLTLGPVASLGGIVMGELAILFYLRRLVAAFRATHG